MTRVPDLLVVTNADGTRSGRCECGVPVGVVPAGGSLDVLAREHAQHLLTEPCLVASPERVRAPRRLPGTGKACTRCGGEIMWAQTRADEHGAGSWVPLDPVEHPLGRVAVIPVARGVIHARKLAADEQHDPSVELQGRSHFTTCPADPRNQ
ncbi:hypothetical protein [Nocardioides bruguierae]|uniref:Uncharacterized protein n=1 Tax=Nocardioides bruguierae TaxID=2945102 RepID=A0A9X2DA91_9ACTN|nr:hypothetical protein [Nocardioides bruguierae]MCM0622197.1 hypothetical protein [Nocardioides bruguierae]